MHILGTCLLLAIAFGVVQSAKKAVRIVGGTPAKPHEFPFFVGIIYKEGGGWSFKCGGSIINSKTVVTSAQCVQGKSLSSYQVRAGVHYTKDLTKDEGSVDSTVQVRSVSMAKPHNCYATHSDNFIGHDIGIIYTSSNFKFNEYVQPIDVPDYKTSGDPDSGGWFTIIGFGYMDGVKLPNVLQKVDVPLVGRDECQTIYHQLWKWGSREKHDLSSGQFCASDATKGASKGACIGDGGGALFTKKGNGWLIHGVTSFIMTQQGNVRNCQSIGKAVPDVHTQVSRYICWLQNPQNWGNCDPNHFAETCTVTHPTTTTTIKPTPSRTTTTEKGETEEMSTTEDPDNTDVTDGEEVTIGASCLFPAISAFLMAILAPKIAIYL